MQKSKTARFKKEDLEKSSPVQNSSEPLVFKKYEEDFEKSCPSPDPLELFGSKKPEEDLDKSPSGQNSPEPLVFKKYEEDFEKSCPSPDPPELFGSKKSGEDIDKSPSGSNPPEPLVFKKYEEDFEKSCPSPDTLDAGMEKPENKIVQDSNGHSLQNPLKSTSRLKMPSPLKNTSRIAMMKQDDARELHPADAKEPHLPEPANDVSKPKSPSSLKNTSRIAMMKQRNSKEPRPQNSLKTTSRLKAPSSLKSTSRIAMMKQKNSKESYRGKKILYGVAVILGCLTLSALCALAFVLYSQVSISKKRWTPRNYNLALSTEQVLSLPDQEFDFAMAALMVARDDFRATYNQDVDIKKHLNTIDRLATQIQSKIDDQMGPEEVIGAISTCLYKNENFQTSQNGWDPSNLYLNLILEGKQGYCLGFVELWLALAERIYWRNKPLPIYGVLIPFHIFCRWDDGKYRRNIETLHVPPPNWKPSLMTLLSDLFGEEHELPKEAGRNMPDAFYILNYGITNESIKKGVYLHKMTPKTVISCIYANRAGLQLDKLKYEKDVSKRGKIVNSAEMDCLEALKWYQSNPIAVRNYANILSEYKGENEKALEILTMISEIDPCAETLFLMGFIHTQQKNFARAFWYFERAEKAKAFSKNTYVFIPYQKARIYYLQKHYDKAIDFCQTYVSTRKFSNFLERMDDLPTIFMLLLLMVDVYNSLGEYDRAMACAHVMKGINEDAEEVLLAFGEIHSRQEQWKDAREYFEKVLWHNPQSSQALKGMGYGCLRQKDYTKACHYLKQALIYDPNCNEAKELLATIPKTDEQTGGTVINGENNQK